MRIAVVGVGPRGLSVLERVISLTRAAGPPVELLLIEPGELGSGVHQPCQPDYLLLNTIASQLTIFSDEKMTPGAPVTLGPSFIAWCRRLYPATRFDDFLPRRMLAEYLRWAAGELLRQVPERLTVRHLVAVASSVAPDRAGALVTLEDGGTVRADLAIVTTGHGLPARAVPDDGREIGTPYPLPDQVERIPPGRTVAVIGAGLTAMDVLAALTVGRGGEFTPDGYRPSGREPVIVLVSRQGWLPCARPAVAEGRRVAPARHLTPEAIARLRASTADGRLDFRTDVEPLILREARWRMRGSATPEQLRAVHALLRPGEQDMVASYQAYIAELVRRARADLAEAELGLGVSPVKDGLEVLRDCRESLRAALDPPGLTDKSHDYFMTTYAPQVNRIVIGPQKERLAELLALIASGVVVPAPGPASALVRTEGGWMVKSTRLRQPHRIMADVVVSAHLSWPATEPNIDPVAASLRAWATAGPGGTPRLDRDGFVVPPPGDRAMRSVAVFGPPAEGASYYNHYVPSPGTWSRALTDLDRVLAPALESPFVDWPGRDESVVTAAAQEGRV
jgi:hypothetical protein